MKVKSGADIRHGTLGIVFSMNCQEMPPPPHSNALGIYMGEASTAQCNGSGAWTA